ncbi:MAG: hypothetical protein KTR31_05755 [Myxococcales bacterium]|nr:hypothetical protein [Myxococcales bacterium]
MEQTFAISGPTKGVRLSPDDDGRLVFSIVNKTGASVAATATLTAPDASWCTLVEEPQPQPLTPYGRRRVVVIMKPPADATPGEYELALTVADPEQPDTPCASGRVVVEIVGEAEAAVDAQPPAEAAAPEAADDPTTAPRVVQPNRADPDAPTILDTGERYSANEEITVDAEPEPLPQRSGGSSVVWIGLLLVVVAGGIAGVYYALDQGLL